jgi:hypothetical protein
MCEGWRLRGFNGEKCIEGMEKFFLGALFAGEKLDIVDQERIQRPVRALEL